MVFLSETLSDAHTLEQIRQNLGFEGCLVVDRIGRSGGLAMLWRKQRMCDVVNYSQNFITVIVHENDTDRWRLTGFYGIPNRGRRKDSWNILRDLASQSNLPWCVIGDFNDILSHDEK